jgi:hypothetical protein
VSAPLRLQGRVSWPFNATGPRHHPETATVRLRGRLRGRSGGDRPVPDPSRLAEAAAREGRSGWLVQWLFARCVQESPDDPDLAGVARRLS